jgi:hypothetical protein
MPLLLQDPVAHWLVVATAVAVVVGEIVASYIGRARDGERRLLGSLADSLLLYVHGRGAAIRKDRGTRLIVRSPSTSASPRPLQSRGCLVSASSPTTGGRSNSGSPLSLQGQCFATGRS